MKPTGRVTVLAAVLAAVTALAPALIAQAGVPGAIFTTDVNGIFVNGNVYDDRNEVFLNGGPRANAPCTAAGLPDGDYVFQVTDPSGAVVLLSGNDSGVVTVTTGLISAYVGQHAMSIGKCGSTTVGLAPFNLTPNPGFEYKVWMTLQSDYLSDGFLPSRSKTDNFKVIPAGPDD